MLMRPKKRILLIDTNEERQSLRRFLLETNGYYVLSAASAEETRALIATEPLDLIVCAWPLLQIDAAALLNELHCLDPYQRVLVLCDGQMAQPLALRAHAVVLPKISAAELLERVKIMSGRKRGPRKMPPLSVEYVEALERRGLGMADRRTA
jgi:two-component system response regulator CpxR